MADEDLLNEGRYGSNDLVGRAERPLCAEMMVALMTDPIQEDDHLA